MRSIRVSGLTALASALALAVTAIPFSGFASGPVVDAPTAATAATAVQAAAIEDMSADTLTLSTTSSRGVVEWDGQRQEFTGGQQCNIVPSPGGASLLDIEGFTGTVAGSAGFRNGDIGVYEFDADGDGPTNAAQCFRVDAGSFTEKETLALTLGADAEDAFGAVIATKATISLAAQSRNGTVAVTLVDDEGQSVGTRTVKWNGRQTGAAIDLKGDFTGEFSGVRMTAEAGAFSLRGASFDLASDADAMFCAGGADTYTNDEGVTVTYIGKSDGSACSAFGIRLTGTNEAKVWFIKPLDVDPEAQFVFEVPWDTVGWPALAPASSFPPVFIDFEDTDPPTLYEMPYCPDYLFNAEGELVGLDGESSADDQDALADLDMVEDVDGDLRTQGTQFACIGDRAATVTKSASGDGYDVDGTDLIYLIGDARMLR